MDETDREVMNLTDRAFKSLCIGDEAIYNDSELLPSPVDCHKPLAEEIPKKPQGNFALDVKKHGVHQPNGMYNRPQQIKNTLKVSSLFAAFASKKNNETKMTNGDSWDKSALLSIQTELSEFSSDYQNHLKNEHNDQVKSHFKTSEKGTDNKSHQDIFNSAGKSSKNHHKLRKLNSKNLFLHSEFSPFRSWEDLNRFSLDNVEMFTCSSPDGLYDSPIYRELNSNISHVPETNKRETSQSTSPLLKSKHNLLQFTATVPSVAENHSEINFPKLPDGQIKSLQPQVLLTSSGSFQRCQSEGDICAPWRKNRSRPKGIVQPLSSAACERSNTAEQGAIHNKKEIRTVEEATSLNSTPFNISQLLTPVIPSRQGTGTLEILQSVQSPTDLNIPVLHETDIHPSPDIKREAYKSKASSLLFNLKDNRKRVKATYSPQKFKGLDAADKIKLSPLIEQVATQNTDSKTTSNVQKINMYPLSPETADIQSSQSSGPLNSTLPDDFLGLSLLQAVNKGSKRNALAKATYPSLNLYQKSSPLEMNTKTISVEVPGSHSTENKNSEQIVSKEYLPDNNSKDRQRKHNLTKPDRNNANHEYTHLNYVVTADKTLTEKTNVVALKEKPFTTDVTNHNVQMDAGSRNQEKFNTGITFKSDERPIKYNEHHKKETKPKHLFSARQNKYIKNQRYANVDDDDDDDEDDECWQEDVISVVRAKLRKRELNVYMDKNNGKVQDSMDDSVTNDDFTKDNYSIPSKNDLGICTEQELARNDVLSMKGNTSAKIALFTLNEKSTHTVPVSLKKNVGKDKNELATVALEKRIAEREQGKKLSDLAKQHGEDLSMKGEHKKECMLSLDQKETLVNVIPDSQGRKAISDFTPTSQKFQSMSDIDTNHCDCHVLEVKLAEPYKQEGAAKHSPSRLISTDSDRLDKHGQQGDTSNNMSMASVTEIKNTVCIPRNMHLGQESSVVQDYIDKNLIRVGEYESCIQKKAKRERANSVSEPSKINERQRKEDVGSVELSVKHEEFLSTEVKNFNLPKDKGQVNGHVSSLMEKLNREQIVQTLNVQESLSQVDCIKGYPINSPEDIMGFSEVKEVLTKHDHKAREADSDKKHHEKESKLTMRNEENLENVNKDVTRNEEDKKDVARTKNKDASDVFRKADQNQVKYKYQGEYSVKEYFIDNFEKSDKPDHACKKAPQMNLLNSDYAPMDKITLYNILNQAEPSTMLNDKQFEQGNLPYELSVDFTFSHKTEESSSLNKGEERKCENLDTIHSNSNPECNPHNADMAIPPPKDMENSQWVRCLIESARNLTPTCQSTVSSPTLGKPALFKVKDNTLTASPVTKTVRPILHKTVAGITQPWSPRESLSGSERGEEDIFKDLVDMQTPVQITQPNQTSIHDVYAPSSQSTTDLERKQLMDSSTVPEAEGLQLAISSVSERIESCDMSAGDPVGNLTFNTVPTDSIQGSKAPSERSDSACSGIENQLQGKPPAVPPKTEKTLRRALKLTTKRNQKAEAKCKTERGRSSEKGSCQKHERRHQSSEKVLSNRPYDREHSIDRGVSNRNTQEDSSETSLQKSHASERHATEYNKPNSHQKEKDSERKLYSAHSSLITMDDDAKSSVAEKKEHQSHHKDQFDTQNINVDRERLGRTREKYLPNLYHRAHSLDRYSRGKYEHRVLSSEGPASKTNAETLKKLTTAQKAPLQNSIEHTYGSSANNMVSQTFPITQRKILQDLDSGQYFVVDMPVQVKTKTFFDPESGSYVQLPVQSIEGSVPRAQSVEVVNAPPLMLYHGFVPVPVSSLP
ncbi:cardiac-enriched FHL2-interacting protein isoform X1 [Tachysurus ichikawai]